MMSYIIVPNVHYVQIMILKGQRNIFSDLILQQNLCCRHSFEVSPGLRIRVHIGKLFSLFLIQNICCGYSKNRLNETVLLSTQNTSHV